MARRPTLSRLELRIMEILWTRGPCSVREIHEALPEKGRPAFSTVGTMVYRLEKKQALRCVKRISNANILEAVMSRDEAHTRLVDDLLALFDGHAKPVMARLVQAGKLTLDDISEAEKAVKEFLVPFSWFVSLGAQLEWRTAPSMAQPAATFVMEESLAPPVMATVASTPAAHTTSAWPWLVASIWVVGVAGVLFWWWRQWRLVHAALGQAKPIALGSAYDVADLTVMSSAWTFEPGVVGIWRPVLLLPEGLAVRLTPAQLNSVIAHERCHIGRHDNLAAAVHTVVEAMFWFHPLVWWMERRMVDERERACDEAVLDAGNDPHEYVAGILTVCRFTLRAPLACVAGVSGAELRTRIESIVRMELGTRMTFTRRIAVALVAAVLLGVPIVAGLVRTPVVVAAFAVPAGPLPLLPIQDPPRQSFEVASVKPNTSGETTSFLQPRPGGNFAVGDMTLRGLIMFAYGIQGFQLVGAPDWWAATERFDIAAKAAADVPPTPIGKTSPEALMLRSLLEDRFRLSAHRETRDLPIYALVLARADGRPGPRLRPTTSDYCKKRFDAIRLWTE